MVWVPVLEQVQPVAAVRQRARVEIAAPLGLIRRVPEFQTQSFAVLLETAHVNPTQHFAQQKDGETAHDPETPFQLGVFPAKVCRLVARQVDC